MKFAIASAVIASAILVSQAENVETSLPHKIPTTWTSPGVWPFPIDIPYVPRPGQKHGNGKRPAIHRRAPRVVASEEDNFGIGEIIAIGNLLHQTGVFGRKDDDEFISPKLRDYLPRVRDFVIARPALYSEEDSFPIGAILTIGSILNDAGVFGKRRDDDEFIPIIRKFAGLKHIHLSEEDNFNIGTILTIADLLGRAGVIKRGDDDDEVSAEFNIGTILEIANVLNQAGVFNGRNRDDDDEVSAEKFNIGTILDIANVLNQAGVFGNDDDEGTPAAYEKQGGYNGRLFSGLPRNDDDAFPIGAIIGVVSLLNQAGVFGKKSDDDEFLIADKFKNISSLLPFDEEDSFPIGAVIGAISLLNQAGVFGKRSDDDDAIFKPLRTIPGVYDEDNLPIGAIVGAISLLNKAGVFRKRDDDDEILPGPVRNPLGPRRRFPTFPGLVHYDDDQLPIGAIITVVDLLGRAGVFKKRDDDDEIASENFNLGTVLDIVKILNDTGVFNGRNRDDDEAAAEFNIGTVLDIVSVLNDAGVFRNRDDDERSIITKNIGSILKKMSSEKLAALSAEDNFGLGTIVTIANVLNQAGVFKKRDDDDEIVSEKFNVGTVLDILGALNQAGVFNGRNRDDDDEVSAEKFNIGTILDIANVLNQAGVFGSDDDEVSAEKFDIGTVLDIVRVLNDNGVFGGNRDDDERLPSLDSPWIYKPSPFNPYPRINYDDDEIFPMKDDRFYGSIGQWKDFLYRK